MELYRVGQAIVAEVLLDGNGGAPLRLEAHNVRRERTGIHATIYITLKDRYLAWTTCNIERDEERSRLARKAHGALGHAARELLGHAGREAIGESGLIHLLDEFCRLVWPTYIEEFLPVMVAPQEGPPYNALLDPPLVLAEGGTVLYGPPGRGKSYTALALAVAMDAAVPCGPLRPLRPLKTLYVNLERPAVSMARRLHAVNTALGLRPDRPLRMVPKRGHTLLDLLPAIEQAVVAGEVGLVVVDSLSRAGAGSLTEDTAANRIMDCLNALHLPWVAIAHTPRRDATHVFGSVMIGAAADICVQVLSEQRDGLLGVGLKVTKANDIPPLPRFPILCYEFSGGALRAIRRARPREFPEVEAEQQVPLPDQVLETVLEKGPMTAGEIAELLGYSRSHVAAALSALEAKGLLTGYRAGREVRYVARDGVLPLDGGVGVEAMRRPARPVGGGPSPTGGPTGHAAPALLGTARPRPVGKYDSSRPVGKYDSSAVFPPPKYGGTGTVGGSLSPTGAPTVPAPSEQRQGRGRIGAARRRWRLYTYRESNSICPPRVYKKAAPQYSHQYHIGYASHHAVLKLSRRKGVRRGSLWGRDGNAKGVGAG